MLKGIDVSAWQGNIDWKAVKESGIGAVILRAGYGKDNYDQKYAPNAEALIELNIPAAIYWFSYAYTIDMARMEGRYAALAAQKKFGTRKIPVAFDFEYDSVSYAEKKGVHIDKATATAYAIAFLTAVKELGYTPMLYTSIGYLRNYFDFDAIKTAVPETLLWLAAWTATIPKAYKDMAVLWQYSSKGSVPGIRGNVDMDEVYTDFTPIKVESVSTKKPKANQMRVTASTLNIRKDPTVNSDDLGDLPKGAIVTVDKIENGWAHFEGWLSASHLK